MMVVDVFFCDARRACTQIVFAIRRIPLCTKEIWSIYSFFHIAHRISISARFSAHGVIASNNMNFSSCCEFRSSMPLIWRC